VMLDALTKSLEAITAADLRELTDRGWPESENVEYKAELHREQANRQDPWYNNGNVSEPSKKKIFKEIVAFANTSGGRLFLGIRETREKPPRAESIQPVPRCAELAERLEQAAINSIDPPLTFFHVTGIPTEPDGTSGVVVAEVSASYSGPHRSSDRECYVRKGTNSVPIGMREIHDIVMRLSRREDEIQRRLLDRGALFESWVGRNPRATFSNLQVGFRVTAIPVGAPLYVENVFRNPAVSRDLREVPGNWRTNELIHRQMFSPPETGLAERPVLGGTKWTGSDNDRVVEKVIFRDGTIDIWFRWPWYHRDQRGPSPILSFDWIVATAANALSGVDGFREAAQAPTCEYGLQVEIFSTNGPADTPVRLVTTPRGTFDVFGSDFATPAILGPYGVGDRDDVMNRIVRDLYDASAVPANLPRLEMEW
jgi:hypothetical protein